MIKSVLLLTLFFSNLLFALECGEYEFNGFIRSKNDSLYIVANENTNSEANLAIAMEDEIKIAPYLNRKAIIKIVIEKKFDGKNGFAKIMSRPELAGSSPLKGSEDTYITLQNKSGCLK